ncbi:MAG: polysaccharide biosynthesis C-terminal domain-containing protein [Bacteroidia bacterium]|nr:polysaccharide biosynthesis C-terminal domain-containing protein [Bacteroidia bacterium]
MPKFTVKTLLSDTLVYGIARFVNIFFSIFLIPIYTRYFTVAEYGIIENLNIFSVLIVGMFGFSLSEGLIRYYTLSESEIEKKELLSTIHYVSLILGVIALVIGLLISNWFGNIFIQKTDSENFLLVLLAIIQAICVINLTIYQSVFRINFRKSQYNVTTIGVVVLSALLSIFFVVILKHGVKSVFLAAAISNFLFAVYGYVKVKPEIYFKYFKFGILKKLLPYCYPLAISGLAILVLRSSDRYFISLLLDNSLYQIGLYTTAEKVMMPLLLITAAFHTAFVPFIMNAAKTEDIKPLLIKSYKLYVGVTTIGVIILSIVAKYILILLTTPSYYPAYKYAYLVGIYLILNTSYYFGGIGLSLKEKTKYIGVFLIVSALINIIFNIILIPQYHIAGALFATIISYLVFNFLIFYKSNQFFEVNYSFRKSLLIIIACGCFSFFSLENTLLGLILLPIFVGMLIYSGFLNVPYIKESIYNKMH